MNDVTRRNFNSALIGGTALTAVASAPSSAEACVSLQGVAADGLPVPHDDELVRMRHFMADLEDMTDQMRYLEPQEAAALRRDLLVRLGEATDGAAATLDRMRVKLDAELALATTGDNGRDYSG